MLSHKNLQEQIKKNEPNKQRFAIKKLTVGVASVLLGVTFAGTASADTTNANSASGSASDGAEQTDHNLVLNSASTTTMKQATAANAEQNTSAAVVNPAGDIKTPAASGYETAVNTAVSAAMENASSAIASTTNESAAAQPSVMKTASSQADNIIGETETLKTETFLPTTTPSSEYTFGEQAVAERKVQTTSKSATNNDINKTYSINVKAVDITTGVAPRTSSYVFNFNFKNGVYTNKLESGKLLYSFGMAPAGYKLLNPEVLTDNFTMDGNMAKVKDRDVDITLEYAPISPILVRYIDEDTGEVLSTSSVGANSSSTASLAWINGDKKYPGPSKFVLHAIDIPGYVLDDQSTFEDTYNNVQSKGNLNYQVHTFKYKKVMDNPNPKDSQKGSGAQYGEYFGPEWNTIDPADIFKVSGVYGQTYEKDSGDVEAKMNYVINKYQNQGYTYMGTFNYHRNTDWYNFNEGGTSINLIPNKSVTVKFIDEQGNKLAADQTIAFNKNNPDQTNKGLNAEKHWFPKGEWKSTPKTFDGYTLRTTYGADHGEFTAYNYVVTYEYAKNAAAQVKYIDDTDNKQLSSENLSGYVGDVIDYSTKKSITDYQNQGYVLVHDGFTPGSKYADGTNTFEVHFKHGVQPVTPTTPGKDVPKNTPKEAQPDQLTKKVNLTVSYVNANGTNFTGDVPANAKQTATFTGEAYVDKITGQLVNAKQEDGKWVIDDANTATPQITWTADKTSFTGVTSPAEDGYHVTNVSAHRDGNNVAAITGLTKDTGDINVVVTYAKNDTEIRNQKSIKTSATVHYEGAGDKTPADNVQDGFTFEYTGDTYDKQTGKEIKKGTWNATSHAYNAVTVPTIKGYHAEMSVVPANGLTVTRDNPTVTVTVKYVANGIEIKNGQTVKASQVVNYVDQNGNKLADSKTQNFTFTYSGDTYDKYTGQKLSNGTWNATSNDFTAENVPVVDGYVLVSGYTSENGKYTAGGFTATNNGTDAQRNRVFTVVYAPAGKIIPVDPSGNPIPNVPTPQYPNDPQDPTKVTPNEPVPDIPGFVPTTPTVTPNVPTTDTPVVYNQVQKADLTIVDQDNGNKQITISGITTKFNADGSENGKIEFNGYGDSITALENLGYEYVGSDYSINEVFDGDSATDQHFTITMKHGTQPVNPDQPGKPGQPINPNDPDGPKYPQGSDQVSKNVTRTVQYVDENGNKLNDPIEQSVDFTAQGILDKVTGQWKTPLTWSGSQTVNGVKTPVVDGYHVVNVDRDADGNNVKGVTLTHENDSYTVTVSYAKNGKIVPVDPSGNPILNVPTPQYPTDPENPAKVTPNEPVPDIPGFVPEVPTVTPTNPGEDTPVKYNPVVNDQTAVVNYVDQDNNNAQIATSGNLSGKPGSAINYSTAETIQTLENQGYVLVSDGFPTGAVFDNDDQTTQTYTVVLKHGTTTFEPDKPGTPGEPINPNYPEGPKVTNEDVDYSRDVKFTVHYVGAGANNPADNVQNARWTRSITVDNVTGNIISSTEWVSNKDNYDGVKTPVVDGYHADRAQVDGAKVTMEDQTETVTYAPNGKIVPVDPEGNPIPNVPTPQYPTDPSNPTTVTPNEPVPTIPGYTPEVPTVTPTNPGVDTPVKYTPTPVNPKPATDQVAVVNYVDQDNNNAQIATSGELTGKAGEKIDYSTAETIQRLEAQGYELVTDGFPANATFDDADDTTQTFTVVLKHGHAPVGPQNPHEPNTPINPGEPDGPQWPTKDNYTKDYTSTVHFVDNNGNKMRDDEVQTSTWTRTLIVDKVTGQILNPGENWTADKGSYDEVKVPVIDGYVADKATVPATPTVQRNLEETVTYTKVGKIVPVDPAGNPLPDVPAVPYTNDPTDPTKVVPNEPVPTVPGKTPEVTTVTPTNPTVDTPVVYTTPTPVTPETPVTPQKDETPEVPATPAAPAQPAAPQAPTKTSAPQQPAAKEEAKTLPQTGNENNSSAAALGLAALGLTGFLAAGKKRRKED